MLVGVPKEIKDSEYRVGLVPSTAGELIANGHRVIIERGAGIGAGLSDADYEAVGAEIVPGADEIYARAELVVKVHKPRDLVPLLKAWGAMQHLSPPDQRFRRVLAPARSASASGSV